jgi:protein-disulfide isomerase
LRHPALLGMVLVLSAATRSVVAQSAAEGQMDVSFSIPPGPVLGRANAPVTIVEYTDLECPFCHRFHMTTFPQIKKTYVDTGKVRFISRDFPLGIHSHAKSAAVASRCGGEQGRFWELRHLLASHPDKLAPKEVLGYAGELGLDLQRFQSCMAANRFAAALQKDLDDAAAAGVTATPTFLIARTAPRAMKGIRIVGAVSFGAFDQKIRGLLERAPTTPH